MEKTLESLQNEFAELAKRQGFICEADYHRLCSAVKDFELLARVCSWLASGKLPLRCGIGEQYKQEVLQKVQNPNVNDVKDTKNRTHVNKDKKQESKRENPPEKTAALYLKKVLEELECNEFDTEFFPPWKKHRTAAGGQLPFETPEQERSALMQAVDETVQDPVQRTTMKKQIQDSVWQDFANFWKMLYPGSAEEPAPSGQFSEYTNVDPNAGQTAPEQPLELDTAPDAWQSWKRSNLDAINDPVQRHLARVASQEYLSKIKKKIKFDNDSVFVVDTAETPAQKAAGLEVFDKLPDKRGLLFVFQPPEHVTFHMGSVRFPIDIIFLTEGHFGLRIAKVVQNVQPGAIDLWSAHDISYVLELPGGSCEQYGLSVGARCEITNRIEV